jgi:hypothetical protein
VSVSVQTDTFYPMYFINTFGWKRSTLKGNVKLHIGETIYHSTQSNIPDDLNHRQSNDRPQYCPVILFVTLYRQRHTKKKQSLERP